MMKRTVKLSLIVPCYNSENNIETLLSELIKNSCAYDEWLEIIVVNDGSTDRTLDLINDCMSLTKINSLVKVYTIENSGAAKARTFGLNKSCGEYVLFIDSDDELSSLFFEAAFHYIESEENIDMLYFSSVMIDDNKELDKIVFQKEITFSNPDDALNYFLKYNNYTAAVWGYIFSRPLLERSRPKFTNRVAHEDHLFTLSLISNSKKIKVIKNKLYFQKLVSGSLTRSQKNYSYIYERYAAFKESQKYMKVSNKFSCETRKLYDIWSMKSYLQLVMSNKKLMNKFNVFYNVLWIVMKEINNVFYILREQVLKLKYTRDH